MATGLQITGRTNTEQFDFYDTPAWATELVLKYILKDGILTKDDDIYEPCSGAGAIVDVLDVMQFTNVRASDIQTADYIVGEKGINVFDMQSNSCDVIFTNPPYNLMTRKEIHGGSMLKDFLRIANKKVILLLNIFFLSSHERNELIKKSHLRHVYIHSDRVTMYKHGAEKPSNDGMKMFTWCVFDNEYDGTTTMSNISKKDVF